MTLRGGGEIEIEGERFPLDPDHVARVGSGVKRKVWPGDEESACSIVGGVPGGLRGARQLQARPTRPDGG